MPLVTKPFSNIITFTRASTGTFTGSNGLIQTATTNTPRFDYDPVTLAAKGLLIEEQRTNLLTRSESFRTQTLAVTGVSGTFVDGETVTATGGGTGIYVLAESTGSSFAIFNGSGTFTGTLTGGTSGATATISSSVAAWLITRSSITANTIVAPDGTLTGDKLVEDTTASGTHLITQAYAFTGPQTQTFSVYVKKGERNWCALRMGTAAFGGDKLAYFDLANGLKGSVTAGTTSDIIPVGNGWYRCTITTTSVSGPLTAGYSVLIATADNISSYTGDGYSGIFIWGAQLEAGAFPTSYIPTVASQVTRSDDAASVNTLSPWYNAAESSVMVGYQLLPGSALASSATRTAVDITDGSTDNRLAIRALLNASLTDQITIRSGGGTALNFSTNGSAVGESPRVVAAAFRADDFAGSATGATTIATTTGSSMPVGINQMRLGGIFAGTSINQINGWLRNVAYYPRRLSNAELQTLTA